MRRPTLLLATGSLLTLLLAGMILAGTTAPTGAQASTPATMAGHPLVGTWLVTTTTGAPAVTVFTSDGAIIDNETGGASGLGTWQATGPTTAAFTFIIQEVDPTHHFVGTLVARGTIMVQGTRFTAPFNYTIAALNGQVMAHGSGTVTATRLAATGTGGEGTPLPAYPTVAGTPAT